MSYHIINIDSPQCSLSCKDGQVTCRMDGEEKPRTVPLEDVASIIITIARRVIGATSLQCAATSFSFARRAVAVAETGLSR